MNVPTELLYMLDTENWIYNNSPTRLYLTEPASFTPETNSFIYIQIFGLHQTKRNAPKGRDEIFGLLFEIGGMWICGWTELLEPEFKVAFQKYIAHI